MATGQWKVMLRAAVLTMVRLVDPAASEGATVAAGDVTRCVVVAPGVQHVALLYSRTGLCDARDWLEATFGRESPGQVAKPGLRILPLLAGIMVLLRPLAAVLPYRPFPLCWWRIT